MSGRSGRFSDDRRTFSDEGANPEQSRRSEPPARRFHHPRLVNELGRLSTHLSLRLDPEPGVAFAELSALQEADLAPIEALALSLERSFLHQPQSADHLRLPPPPVRAASGYALFSAMGRAVACFEKSKAEVLPGERAALVAEARMMALLRGIHGLEQQIRDQMSRSQRA